MLHMIYALQEFGLIMVLSVHLSDPNIESFFLNAWIGMITRSVFCIKT